MSISMNALMAYSKQNPTIEIIFIGDSSTAIQNRGYQFTFHSPVYDQVMKGKVFNEDYFVRNSNNYRIWTDYFERRYCLGTDVSYVNKSCPGALLSHGNYVSHLFNKYEKEILEAANDKLPIFSSVSIDTNSLTGVYSQFTSINKEKTTDLRYIFLSAGANNVFDISLTYYNRLWKEAVDSEFTDSDLDDISEYFSIELKRNLKQTNIYLNNYTTSAGADKLIIQKMPDLSVFPRFKHTYKKQKDDRFKTIIKSYCQQFNDHLEAAAKRDKNIILLDQLSPAEIEEKGFLLEAYQASGIKYDGTKVDLSNFSAADHNDANRFAFYDETHPTDLLSRYILDHNVKQLIQKAPLVARKLGLITQ